MASAQTADQAAPAQSATQTNGAAPQTAKSSTVVKPVTVTAASQAFRHDVDRRSYSLNGDLQKTNGSLADALRNVPSVDVDPQGNISLRGDANVTILVDGQPSVLFQGANRADVLQQLPADQFERVEVMTNPSAAFSPEGSAGIINLITRKAHGATHTGSLNVSAGALGRDNANVSETWSSGKLSLSGNAGVRTADSITDTVTTEQIADPASGQTAQVVQTTHTSSVNTSLNANGSADYDLDAKTRWSSQLGYYRGDYDTGAASAYRSSATSGVLAEDYNDIITEPGDIWYVFGSSSLLRQLGGEDHQFLARAYVSADDITTNERETQIYQLPALANLYQDLPTETDQRSADIKAEYKGPLPGQSKLVAGYEFQFNQSVFDHGTQLGTDAADAVLDPALSNRFQYDQAVHSLYATYQRPLGPIDVMTGLRLEEVVIGTDQLTTGLKNGQSYFEAYPTLHLGYKLSDTTQFTASYSRRVQRPDPQSLNPFRVYYNPLYYTQGDPNLRPAITDAFEAGYEYTKASTYILATLYDRDTHNAVSSITDNLGGGALLGTFANIGQDRNTGLELVANGQITKTLTYNLTGNVFRDDLDSPGPGGTGDHSGTVLSGHAKLNWQPTANDFFQIGAYLRSNQVTAQGYNSAYATLNLGYRHKFGDRLAMVLTAQDPFDMFRQNTIIDTPTLHQQTDNNFHQRAFAIGFSYALGTPGKQAAAPKDFDFGGGAGGPPVKP